MDTKNDILKPYTVCEEDKPCFVDPENCEDIVVGNKFKTWLEERKAANSDKLGYIKATSGEEL